MTNKKFVIDKFDFSGKTTNTDTGDLHISSLDLGITKTSGFTFGGYSAINEEKELRKKKIEERKKKLKQLYPDDK